MVAGNGRGKNSREMATSCCLHDAPSKPHANPAQESGRLRKLTFTQAALLLSSQFWSSGYITAIRNHAFYAAEKGLKLVVRRVERHPKDSYDLLDISECRTYKTHVTRIAPGFLAVSPFLRPRSRLNEETGAESKKTADR